MKRFTLLFAALVALVAMPAANAQPKKDKAPAATDTAKPTTAKAKTTTATAKEIADAKAAGMVWANTDSKIYHKDGEFYGNTKQGKFMTEADATKAGFRAARTGAVKGKPKTTTTDTPKKKS